MGTNGTLKSEHDSVHQLEEAGVFLIARELHDSVEVSVSNRTRIMRGYAAVNRLIPSDGERECSPATQAKRHPHDGHNQ
jgi:hypothetical protein